MSSQAQEHSQVDNPAGRREPAESTTSLWLEGEHAGAIIPLVDRQSPPWSVTAKSIIAIAVLVLSGLVVWRFQDLLRPIVIAAVFAYLVNPLISWSMVRFRVGRGQATVMIYLTLLLLVVVGLGVLGYMGYEQVGRLSDLLPNTMGEFVNLTQARLDQVLGRVSVLVGYDLHQLEQTIELRSMLQQGASLLQSTLRQGGSLAASLAQSTFSTLANGVLIFFISLYLAKDSPQFFQGISDAAHQSGYRRDAERLIRDSVRIWDAYLRGQVILGLVIGLLVTLGLSALGVNNALGLGILSGLLEFLPVIGPLIGTVAAVLVALFQPSNYLGLEPHQLALAVLVLMIVIQQLENNLLVPRIVGDALDLHAIVVMVGVLMGASLAGILGA
nr:AI-2E family transporter [Caldilineaceae bacterium]